uniref:Cytochrome b n=1 Tax=Sarcoptes scabiei TaxID=52283 RepID=A0A343IT08_SARSC|nr:cytochrome b [Sarcoptes scabiei]AST11142.1 cytochrome b [Sarcoptes scabiei]
MNKNYFMNNNMLILTLKNSLLNLPTPSSISYFWNMGFLLGMTLMCQIITGFFLSVNFVSETNISFYSVIHIMRDVDYGWFMRYIHMNGASLFFIIMYLHFFRGLYYNSFLKLKYVWLTGIIILLLSMMTAFMGYVLPWGQMSFWGATVITSMLSAIPYLGDSLTNWLWGNFSVSQSTLNRFLSLHFLLPFIILLFVIFHLIFLHEHGSSNPLGLSSDYDKLKFFPFFFIKDFLSFFFVMFFFFIILGVFPNMLGDVENYNEAMYMVTPTHIQPEWYFLYAYAILRSVPSKIGGVILMVFSILIFIFLIFKKNSFNKKFFPFKKFMFWIFVNNVFLLTWIGSNPVEPPYVTMGMFFTFFYFLTVIML